MIARVAVATLLSAAAIAAAPLEDTLTRSAQAKPGGALTLDTEYGAITVTPGDSSRVSVAVYRKLDGRSDSELKSILADFDLEVVPTAAGVTVKGRFKTGWQERPAWSGLSTWKRGRNICHDNKCLEYADTLREFQFTVTVPREYSVDLQTRGGSVTVGDLKGSATARTSGGSLHFGRIEGQVKGRTSGGSITLAGTIGSADVGTSGGSIRIGDVRGSVNAITSGGSVEIERSGGPVVASTSGGSIRVRDAAASVKASTSGGNVHAILTEQPKADCDLSTSGGNVTIELAGKIGVALDASTSGGRVSLDDVVVTTSQVSRTSIRGSVNGGGPALKARTSGGSIVIKRHGEKLAMR